MSFHCELKIWIWLDWTSLNLIIGWWTVDRVAVGRKKPPQDFSLFSPKPLLARVLLLNQLNTALTQRVGGWFQVSSFMSVLWLHVWIPGLIRTELFQVPLALPNNGDIVGGGILAGLRQRLKTKTSHECKGREIPHQCLPFMFGF